MQNNKNCVLRLSRYKSALNRLKSMGFVKVFSDNLADAVGVTSSQVRKDFSIFGISAGSKRGGYKIDELIERLNKILGKEEVHKVIIVGAGHIGQALMKYKGFEIEGIKIAAVFDIDPARFSREAGEVPVLPLEDIKDYIKTHQIKIGIMAVPDIAAQQVFELLLAAGIKGVLNFAPTRLRGGDHCVVNNVNIELELENLLYYVNSFSREKNK